MEKCTGCGRCISPSFDAESFICFNGAKELCGKDYTADEVLGEILKDKMFYDNSNGGVTFSGGECMLQIDFLAEILRLCKENGIRTAVDTAGNVPFEYFERILEYTDLFLYDIKCFDSDKHKLYTGAGNELILENLKRLLTRTQGVWIRIPIIPTVNDTIKEMKSIKSFLSSCKSPERIELLPYHTFGESKYATINRTARTFSTPDQSKIELLKAVFDE